jgi:hypothetical protein
MTREEIYGCIKALFPFIGIERSNRKKMADTCKIVKTDSTII